MFIENLKIIIQQTKHLFRSVLMKIKQESIIHDGLFPTLCHLQLIYDQMRPG